MTVEAELVEAKTTEKIVEFEVKHLSSVELPQLKAELERNAKYRQDVIARLQVQKLQQDTESVRL